MKILISIGHPAQVHVFKNIIYKLKERGNSVIVASRRKDNIVSLLDNYHIDHSIISTSRNNIIWYFIELLNRNLKVFVLCLKYNPDILLGMGGNCFILSSLLLKKKVIIFTDYFLKYENIITHPHATYVITPSNFKEYIGKNQIKVDSYKELAYLHPNNFKHTPNKYKIEDELFILIRFASYGALHDIGHTGLNDSEKIEIVNRIKQYGKVIIITKEEVPNDLKKYLFNGSEIEIHQLLFEADILFCESQTMSTEAAVLGTPVVRCNDWVRTRDSNNFIELEQKYGLIWNYHDYRKALDKLELLILNYKKEEYDEKRKKLLEEKIDFCNYIIQIVYKELNE